MDLLKGEVQSAFGRGLLWRLATLDPAKDAVSKGEPERGEEDARPGLFRKACRETAQTVVRHNRLKTLSRTG